MTLKGSSRKAQGVSPGLSCPAPLGLKHLVWRQNEVIAVTLS
jgi:hypothetical protein